MPKFAVHYRKPLAPGRHIPAVRPQGRCRSIHCLLPPLSEQRAIAAVLDSIDDAIEGAEAVIAATEGLRDALLHDQTHPRPPRPAHTEFRDVPGLGTIPADWEVVRLGDVIATVRNTDYAISQEV